MMPVGAMGVSNDAEEGLGDAMATEGDPAPGGQVRAWRDGVDEDDEDHGRLRARIAHLRIGHLGELSVPVFRSSESIKKSREEQIDHLLSSKAVRDWDVEDAKATGAKI